MPTVGVIGDGEFANVGGNSIRLVPEFLGFGGIVAQHLVSGDASGISLDDGGGEIDRRGVHVVVNGSGDCFPVDGHGDCLAAQVSFFPAEIFQLLGDGDELVDGGGLVNRPIPQDGFERRKGVRRHGF